MPLSATPRVASSNSKTARARRKLSYLCKPKYKNRRDGDRWDLNLSVYLNRKLSCCRRAKGESMLTNERGFSHDDRATQSDELSAETYAAEGDALWRSFGFGVASGGGVCSDGCDRASGRGGRKERHPYGS